MRAKRRSRKDAEVLREKVAAIYAVTRNLCEVARELGISEAYVRHCMKLTGVATDLDMRGELLARRRQSEACADHLADLLRIYPEGVSFERRVA